MRQNTLSVLAIYPGIRGYAFVLFESRSRLGDWGRRDMRGSRNRSTELVMAEIEKMIERVRPDAIVIEDHTEHGSRRTEQIRRLHRAIAHAARSRGAEFERISRRQVCAAFASVGATTRYEIAHAVGREFPELGYRLPRRRDAWDNERTVMALFAAAALGIAFYSTSALNHVE
jgi:hypothetical protein